MFKSNQFLFIRWNSKHHNCHRHKIIYMILLGWKRYNETISTLYVVSKNGTKLIHEISHKSWYDIKICVLPLLKNIILGSINLMSLWSNRRGRSWKRVALGKGSGIDFEKAYWSIPERWTAQWNIGTGLHKFHNNKLWRDDQKTRNSH